jgi:fibronectin-binding autotransporter adhesin
VANVRVSAEAGGKVIFSGNINDDNSDASTRNYAPVSVLGGGTVELSGSNNYRGGTSIIGGTTLLANGGGTVGSSTGLGNVHVGWEANSFSGDLTSGQSYITGLSSLSGLVVGQTITGTGIVAGTTITYVDPTRNRIEISTNATASGSTALATEATTGVLGGSGHIRPGVVNGVQQAITVAAGSSIAPGHSIETLVLDGGGTEAGLLTMSAGSTFTFELGAGNASDQLSFWNYAAGDFVLNNNVINFSGAQEGEYTLFTFYSGAGSGFIDAGIDGGLVVGTGLEGFTYELIYNGNSIILNVVPEPASCVLAGLGLTMVLWMRRRA